MLVFGTMNDDTSEAPKPGNLYIGKYFPFHKEIFLILFRRKSFYVFNLETSECEWISTDDIAKYYVKFDCEEVKRRIKLCQL